MQLESDDFRNQHRYRLSEHCRFGLDSADAPAEYAESVDHRRVRIGADERVGIGGDLAVYRIHEHCLREILEVDLVDDSGVRGNDAEILQRLLAPAEKCVALLVALELEVRR